MPAEPPQQQNPASEALDLERLARWCRAHSDGFEAPLTAQRIKGGASNPTFDLRSGSRRYVLRKKPPGQLLPSAHQVEREFRVMRALAATNVPVPPMRLLCEEPDVIGTTFFIMDFVEGRIFRDASLPGLSKPERTAVYDRMNEVLAHLHQVDVVAVGLADFGRPGNYFARQIDRWTKQYRAAQTEEIEPMERLIEALPSRIPEDDSATLVHGDYRLENMIFHPTEARVLAVLDWELSTRGHPLADLAYNCLIYYSNSPTFGSLREVDLAATGIPTEKDYVAAYCRRTGRSEIANWNFYLAFSMFRIASIVQGVLKRAMQGQSDQSRLESGSYNVHHWAAQAWKILQSGTA